jgi:hypothetical protein
MMQRREWIFQILACVIVAWRASVAPAAEPWSVGRGAPDPVQATSIVGSEGKGLFTGAGVPPDNHPIYATRDGAVPAGIQPLPVDIFSTRDFYKDRALWMDKRYYRCNSPVGIEQIWGAYEVPLIGNDPPRTAAWGFCERDYPRDQIVSPYPFRSAKEHYASLLAQARRHGGPTQYTQATLPQWSGHYLKPKPKTTTWYYGAVLQVPTYLSLLTPEYQLRFVQEMYHYSGSNSPQWPGSYCWPEGFMRRLAQYGLARMDLIVTPDEVLDIRNAAEALVTQIHIGRQFDESGPVPRLGPAVPQWLGETIGFWDGEALITWTSNVQPWINHGGSEFSDKMQSIEIYTPRKDEHGRLIGLRHEVVLYDPEAFVDPVRIVMNLERVGRLNKGDPLVLVRCVPTIFPVNGVATPETPGSRFEYEVPDIFGRPWAQIWEKYHERGMDRPPAKDLFSFPQNGK